MARSEPSRRIPLGSDWEIEAELHVNDEPLGGATVVVGFISATRAGAAIHATLQVNLARDVVDTRIWRGTILGANINTHLTALVDVRVWEIITVDGTSLRAARWLFVRDAFEL